MVDAVTLEDEVELRERELDRLLQVWKEQESIAMHFNDLLARFRVQALGGAATIGAVAAVVFTRTGGPEDHSVAGWMLVGLLSFLYVAWAAIWRLDYSYYKPLLNGAVKCITRLEAQLPESWRMSTSIEGESKLHGRKGHFLFYGYINVALCVLLIGASTRVNNVIAMCSISTLALVFCVVSFGLARTPAKA